MTMNIRTLTGVGVAILGLGVLCAPALAEGDQPAKPAQDRPHRAAEGAPRQGMMLERFKETLKDLNLSADQQTQVDQILADAKTQAEANKGDMEKMKELMRSTHEKINKVLTEEQQKKLQAALTRGGAGAGQGAAGGKGGMIEHIQQAVQELGLTDEQKTQVKGLIEEYRPKFQAIRQEANGDAKTAMEKAKPLFQEFREKLNGILTPEQAAQLKEKIEQAKEKAGGAATGESRPGAGARQHKAGGGDKAKQ